MNMRDPEIWINTNMLSPGDNIKVQASEIAKMEQSPVSMMMPGLINTMQKDDVLDLLAYLLSKGNPKDALFFE